MEKDIYVNEVMKRLFVNSNIKKRIKEDLSQRIDDALDSDPYYDIISDLGDPKTYASELMQGLNDEDKTQSGKRWGYEYTSEKTIFGYPLVHINVSNRQGSVSAAKGIIAIGDAAFGVVAIGGFSAGLISLGGIGIGLLSLGGISLGIVSFGGISAGLYAFGGVAIGLKSFGGVAIQFLLKSFRL
jgi:hypothetical protein